MSDRASREAFVTLATNDTYSLGCLVLGSSLRKVGTTRRLVVMVSKDVSLAMRSQLLGVFDFVQEVDVLDSRDPINLALLGRPDLNVTFTKLHCWRLTQFEKCVFLDADTLVLQNVDELFDREELAAAPDAGWPDCFNSGVFVFRPSKETYQSILKFATSQGSFDGGDQGVLNMYFRDWATKDISKHLPFIYNVVSQAFYSYLPAFTQFKDNVKIVHFIGAVKPWHHTYNTSSRTVTPLPGTGHSQEFLQIWWDIFMGNVQPKLDPSLRRKRVVVPTVVIWQPKSERVYAYIPKSNLPVIKYEKEAPWSWSMFPWSLNSSSPIECCKMAMKAFSRCWRSKPARSDQLQHVTELNKKLLSDLCDDIDHSPDRVPKETPRFNEYYPSETTIQTVYPYKLPDGVEVFYDTKEDNRSTDNPGRKSSEKDIVDLPVLPREYTELESHYSEEPISHINPDQPPSSAYDAKKVSEGWEKGNTPSSKDSTEHSDKSNGDSSDTNKLDEKTNVITDDEERRKMGLCGELASLKIEGGSTEQRIDLSDAERKLNWEKGQIDYLGQDSFENIQKKIQSSLEQDEAAPPPQEASSPFTPAPAPTPKQAPKSALASSTAPAPVKITATEPAPAKTTATAPAPGPVKKTATAPAPAQVKTTATVPAPAPVTTTTTTPAPVAAKAPAPAPAKAPAPAPAKTTATAAAPAQKPTQAPAQKTSVLNITTTSKKK